MNTFKFEQQIEEKIKETWNSLAENQSDFNSKEFEYFEKGYQEAIKQNVFDWTIKRSPKEEELYDKIWNHIFSQSK